MSEHFFVCGGLRFDRFDFPGVRCFSFEISSMFPQAEHVVASQGSAFRLRSVRFCFGCEMLPPFRRLKPTLSSRVSRFALGASPGTPGRAPPLPEPSVDALPRIPRGEADRGGRSAPLCFSAAFPARASPQTKNLDHSHPPLLPADSCEGFSPIFSASSVVL